MVDDVESERASESEEEEEEMEDDEEWQPPPSSPLSSEESVETLAEKARGKGMDPII